MNNVSDVKVCIKPCIGRLAEVTALAQAHPIEAQSHVSNGTIHMQGPGCSQGKTQIWGHEPLRLSTFPCGKGRPSCINHQTHTSPHLGNLEKERITHKLEGGNATTRTRSPTKSQSHYLYIKPKIAACFLPFFHHVIHKGQIRASKRRRNGWQR